MNIIEKAILTTVFLLVVATTVWIQIQPGDNEGMIKSQGSSEKIDYYVTNFTTTSINNEGLATHVLEGAKMIHYADNDTAFIDTPHVIEYKKDDITQHTYGQTADVGPGGDTVVLNNDVKIYEHPTIEPDDQNKPKLREVLSTNKLSITLAEESDENENAGTKNPE